MSLTKLAPGGHSCSSTGKAKRVEEQNSSGALVITARYTYDLMGRMLTAVTGTSTTQTRTWVYNSAGHLTSASNDGYTWHYAYDIGSRIYKQTLQTPASGSAQAQYTYL